MAATSKPTFPVPVPVAPDFTVIQALVVLAVQSVKEVTLMEPLPPPGPKLPLPGSIRSTVLWIGISLGFRFYVTNFGSYNATYGTIGGVIVLLLWLYVSALAVLIGAEMNAEIEHASPYGKDPGEKTLGEKKQIGSLAQRSWEERARSGTLRPAWGDRNCGVDAELPPAPVRRPSGPRASDWVLSGLVLGQAALLTWTRLRSRFNKVGS